ncbi:Glutathione peroxidase 6 [Octopus vulgaris]|uniref:Glutathione peroxidase n=1 Tax=Octopus vulgaris TaxID=6645 RepID=A0AA36BTE3_OCTVU|nr:Glutathione peroxidase 6 [Octopus vulgaris]
MNALQKEFKDFHILGFPCNQFWLQEPGANGTEILNCLANVRPGKGFKPNFPLFQKTDVNGKKENGLFTYLKSYCPSPKQDFAFVERLHYKPMSANDIRWNFEKFLINRKGKPVMRFATAVLPDEIRPYIVHLLEEKEEF